MLKRAEEEIRHSREVAERARHETEQRATLLEATLESSVNAIIVYGPELEVLRYNQAARILYGFGELEFRKTYPERMLG